MALILAGNVLLQLPLQITEKSIPGLKRTGTPTHYLIGRFTGLCTEICDLDFF
jgi:hypothetical protein